MISHGGESLLMGAKRGLGLVIARMLGWKELMFLNDDSCDAAPQ